MGELERYQTPQLRPRQLQASQDAHLHLWVRDHPHLQPTNNVAEWEPSATLLLLWEVDHAQSWPTTASSRSDALAGFTKKLQKQAQRDDLLKLWFTPKEMQRPLALGLAETHQLFWPVRVRPPAPTEPRGWYEDFVTRWKAYIATFAVPLGVAATSSAAQGARRVRPRVADNDPVPSMADPSTAAAPKRRARQPQIRAPPEGPTLSPPDVSMTTAPNPCPIVTSSSEPATSIGQRCHLVQPLPVPPSRKRRRSGTSTSQVITPPGDLPPALPAKPAAPTQQKRQ